MRKAESFSLRIPSSIDHGKICEQTIDHMDYTEQKKHAKRLEIVRRKNQSSQTGNFSAAHAGSTYDQQLVSRARFKHSKKLINQPRTD